MKPITLFTILFVSLLSGCVTPPDLPVLRALEKKKVVTNVPGIGDVIDWRPNPTCMKEVGEPVCGYAVWTITDKTQYISEAKKHWLDGKPWSQVQRDSVMVPADGYAKIKKYIIDSCKQSGDCSKDIDHWRVKLDSIDSVFSIGN